MSQLLHSTIAIQPDYVGANGESLNIYKTPRKQAVITQPGTYQYCT